MTISLLQNNNGDGNAGSLTSPAGATCLVVAIGGDHPAEPPTWNGVSLTTVISNTKCNISYLLIPAIGTYTLVTDSVNGHSCYAAFWLSGTHLGDPQRAAAEGTGSDGWGQSSHNLTCSDTKIGDFVALAGWNYFAHDAPSWSGTGVTEDENFTNGFGRGSAVGHLLTAATNNPVVTFSHEWNDEGEYSLTCWAAFKQSSGGGIMWWS